MENLVVSYAPHLTKDHTTNTLMLDVLIALFPAMLLGVFYFGGNAAYIIVISMFTALASEFLFNVLFTKKYRVEDISSLVTGLIVALVMPPAIPLYVPAICAFFAIWVVKMPFGGIGRNFLNPAATAKVFMFLIFGSVIVKSYISAWDYQPSLYIMDFIGNRDYSSFALADLFIGGTPGCIGETSVAALLLGYIYLIARGVIDYKIPALITFFFAIFVLLFGGASAILPHIMSGGFMFMAIFMATDYTTSPNSFEGVFIYTVIIAGVAALFRLAGDYVLAPFYALLTSNMVVPILDRYIIPRHYGKGVKLPK